MSNITDLTPEQIERLKKSFIPEQQWEHCYFTESTIFTPIYDELGKIKKNGKTIYDESIYDIENKPVPKKTTEQKLAEITLKLCKSELEKENLNKQTALLTLEFAKSNLKIEQVEEVNLQLISKITLLQTKLDELINTEEVV